MPDLIPSTMLPPPRPKPKLQHPPAPPDPASLQLRYKLSTPTFSILSAIPGSPDRRAILQTASQATEFRSFPIHAAEKAFFRTINETKPIPYLIREAVSQPWHKVFLLVQIDLMNDGWPSKLSAAARKELHGERGRIYNILEKCLRCLVDILGQRMDGRGVTTGLDVLRSIKAGVWEGNGQDLLQVEGIGPARAEKLAKAGVRNIRQLSGMDFFHIERLLSRNPPFGQQVLRAVACFPLLNLKLDVVSRPPGGREGDSTWIARILISYDNEEMPQWKKARPWTTLVIEGENGRLVWFWRGSTKKLSGGKEIVVSLNAKKGEQLKVVFACEEVVGTLIKETFRI
ncbi:Sec63 domain-containing protein [Emericellopsis atlantica]|uniref:Sec63 domain-containing protein n=1 Tax=Emericellopsis atlantica TaxID=2614577 RepID=A0A9P8CRM5_9HYPO|nr:Sec63 domain-containing protein [Emericellopsis atlantica]KAG9256918.1 Sec63 domain-containing protein [Emericellopsis atlantica]